MRQVISGITAAVVVFLAAANTAHAQGEYYNFEGEAYPPITRTLTFRDGPDGYEGTSDDINRLILVVPAEDPPTDVARAVAFADELFEQVAAPGLQQHYTATFPQDFFIVPQELVYEIINNDMNTIRISIEHREEDQWGPIYTRQVVDYEERPGGAWERVSHEGVPVAPSRHFPLAPLAAHTLRSGEDITALPPVTGHLWVNGEETLFLRYVADRSAEALESGDSIIWQVWRELARAEADAAGAQRVSLTIYGEMPENRLDYPPQARVVFERRADGTWPDLEQVVAFFSNVPPGGIYSEFE